jgi:hypothetical protein
MVDDTHVDHRSRINMDYHEYTMYLNQLMKRDNKSNHPKNGFEIKSQEIKSLLQLNL